VSAGFRTMNVAKPLVVRGIPVANGKVPLICAPLVGRTPDEILAEVAESMQKSPDIVEWRVDHFAHVDNAARVVELARRIKAGANGAPVIFTARSAREGGARTPLGDSDVVMLHEAVCGARCIDFVDYELDNGAADFARVRSAARTHGIAVIGSHHDFDGTPAIDVLLERFAQAARAGADVAKVAVMPRDPRDVLTLLDATWQASRSVDIPLISMSMGPLGALSRVAGFAYGSALTFGVGADSSAPGQLAIEDLRTAIAILRAAMGAGRADD
jgi:3-dehydroquinate dehydratase-1